MIQRIQTLYLILSATCLGSLFFLPFATSIQPIPELMNDNVYDITDHPALLGITIIGLLLSVISIFSFKNRSTQKKLVNLLIIICIMLPLVALLFFYNEATYAPAKNLIKVDLGIFTPIVALIMSVLAWRGISKDDKIVRSMDRLR